MMYTICALGRPSVCLYLCAHLARMYSRLVRDYFVCVCAVCCYRFDVRRRRRRCLLLIARAARAAMAHVFFPVMYTNIKISITHWARLNPLLVVLLPVARRSIGRIALPVGSEQIHTTHTTHSHTCARAYNVTHSTPPLHPASARCDVGRAIVSIKHAKL